MQPDGPIKARLVFVHGFSDHCEYNGVQGVKKNDPKPSYIHLVRRHKIDRRVSFHTQNLSSSSEAHISQPTQKGNTYNDLFSPLTARDIEIHTWDQRGWGLSVTRPREKGLTGPTSLVLSDIDTIINHTLSTTPDSTPLFLMGHSMGGGEILTYAALGPASTRRHIRGYLAEAPFLDLSPATKPFAITEIAGRMASKVLPHFHMVNKLNANLLSRDQAVGRAIGADPLCHDTGTLEGLAGMLDRGANLCKDRVVAREDARAAGETGMWVSHGSGDGIVSFDASRDWAERLEWKDKVFKKYDGWYHRCE